MQKTKIGKVLNFLEQKCIANKNLLTVCNALREKWKRIAISALKPSTVSSEIGSSSFTDAHSSVSNSLVHEHSSVYQLTEFPLRNDCRQLLMDAFTRSKTEKNDLSSRPPSPSASISTSHTPGEGILHNCDLVASIEDHVFLRFIKRDKKGLDLHEVCDTDWTKYQACVRLVVK